MIGNLPREKSDVRSILILTKHRYMGDTIVAVPLLRATRAAFPHAHITLLTGPAGATALRHCPYIDSVVHHDPRTRARTMSASARLTASLWRTMREIRQTRRPDICLIPDRSLRSAAAAWLAGGEIRAGFDAEYRRRLLTHPVKYDPSASEIGCCLEILMSVVDENCPPDYDNQPELWLSDDEREHGAAILREHGLLRQGLPVIGIQPGASEARKQWETGRFAQLTEEIRRRGFPIVLLGSGMGESAASRYVLETVSRNSKQNLPVDLTGRTTLREMMSVVSHLSLFVGNDTGIMHIAASLQIPTVALFGPTKARKWGHWGTDRIVLESPDRDLRRLDVNTVVDAVLGMLPERLPKPIPIVLEALHV